MNRIPVEEYRERTTKLQAAMVEHGLDALWVYSWKRGPVRYLSGYHPNYIANVAVLVLPKDGSPALRIRFPFDLERARQESWIEDIAASGNLTKLVTDSAEVLRQRGLASGRIGLVTGDATIEEMPYNLYALMQHELPDAALVEAGDLLRKMRLRKSPAEFALLRDCARLTQTGTEAAQQVLKPGCTEYEVVAAAEGAMRRLGAESYLVVISSKGVSELIGPPEAKVIEASDNVILEIAAQNLGYTTQVARVFYVGGPTPAQREIYTAARYAYLAALELARPGNTCADLAAVMQQELDRRGLGQYLEQDLGHGIGIDLPEPPRIERKDLTQLEAGMVLVIHPAVRVPGVGGVFLGGTVLIHDSGPEAIHTIPESP
jgi:Xaa-Pro dipeptidase